MVWTAHTCPAGQLGCYGIERNHGGKRGRSQAINQAQDGGEQCSRYGDLCEVECDVAAMTRDPGADLDELVPQGGGDQCSAVSGNGRVRL